MVVPPADVLLVVPPLASLRFPHLGVHLLQAGARRAGFDVRVLYAGALYAAVLGPDLYESLCNAPGPWLLGERLFTRAAFGTPALGVDAEQFLASVPGDPMASGQFDPDDILRAAGLAEGFVVDLAASIDARIVGATTTFEQTSAALAILAAARRARPDVTTVLGGANCEGPMARGILSLGVPVDAVFSGEADAAFVAWLRDPVSGVIPGAPVTDMDALPVPDYTDYFEQIAAALPGWDADLWLSMETSRGCWWGQRRHCTFCGLNGEGMVFRGKSADRALSELATLVERHPSRRICLTDNIMPHRYFRTFIPKIREVVGEVELFYEQKANLTLDQVHRLVHSGVKVIQPGIESLSTPTLDLMRKGVMARQNLALLRYAAGCGLGLNWNLLYGLPGDDAAEYRAMLDLLPKLRHLCPPHGLVPLSIDRFSPYYDDPASFGISEVRPLPAYRAVFPDGDVAAVAYHFEGVFASGSADEPDTVRALAVEVAAWRTAWGSEATRPALVVRAQGPDTWVLIDTRWGGAEVVYLSRAQVAACVAGGPLERVPGATWAIRNRYAVDVDGWCVPLAVAPYALTRDLEVRIDPEDGAIAVLSAS